MRHRCHHMSICACHVLTDFLFHFLSVFSFFFSFLDTTRRIFLFSVQSGAERCVIFLYAFCYYLFFSKIVTRTCHPASPYALWFSLFLSFYHCCYPAHQITVCNVYILFDTIQIQTRTRSLLLLINASPSLSHPSSLSQHAAIPARCCLNADRRTD